MKLKKEKFLVLFTKISEMNSDDKLLKIKYDQLLEIYIDLKEICFVKPKYDSSLACSLTDEEIERLYNVLINACNGELVPNIEEISNLSKRLTENTEANKKLSNKLAILGGILLAIGIISLVVLSVIATPATIPLWLGLLCALPPVGIAGGTGVLFVRAVVRGIKPRINGAGLWCNLVQPKLGSKNA